MVKYRGKVVRVEPVHGEGGLIIEAWVTFKVEGCEIETYHVGIPIAPKIGKEYIIDFRLMAYDLHQINIEDKMLKQISTFPMDPLYVVTGQVLEHDPDKGRTVVDCGILLECDTSGKLLRFWRNKIKAGDWVYLMGKMFGEIVGDNCSGDGKE